MLSKQEKLENTESFTPNTLSRVQYDTPLPKCMWPKCNLFAATEIREGGQWIALCKKHRRNLDFDLLHFADFWQPHRRQRVSQS